MTASTYVAVSLHDSHELCEQEACNLQSGAPLELGMCCDHILLSN